MVWGGNSSQHVEDSGLLPEPLLDGTVLFWLPGSQCCMAETAEPSVTLYFHLSVYQRGGPQTLTLLSQSPFCSTGQA